MNKYIIIALLSFFFACGREENPTQHSNKAPRSEIVFQEVNSILDGTVQIDSIQWIPYLPLNLPNGTFEINGIFNARFINNGDNTIWIRYDLRFFDDDEFLIDDFIPFNQPIVLEPKSTVNVEGEFSVRAANFEQAVRIEIMHLVVRVRLPD